MSNKIPSAHSEINKIESLASRYENGEITALEVAEEIMRFNVNDMQLRNFVESLPREDTARLLSELGQNNPVFGRLWDIFSKERRISQGQIEDDSEYSEGEIFETELQNANKQLSAWQSSTCSGRKAKNNNSKNEDDNEDDEEK